MRRSSPCLAATVLVASFLAALVGCGGAPSAPAAAPRGCEPVAFGPSGAADDRVADARIEETPAEPSVAVRAGECETDWLPAGVVRDVPPGQTEELVELVRGWLAGEGQAPLIEHQRGILFVKSADDEGADPPYPSSSAATSLRACGLTSSWLRDHLRATFAMAASPELEGVTCDENVCCIPGMEFVSDRTIVLRRTTWNEAPAWVLESAYEVAEAALGDEHVAANRGYVAAQLARGVRGTCPGEPPGVR